MARSEQKNFPTRSEKASIRLALRSLCSVLPLKLTRVHVCVNLIHVREIYFYRKPSGGCPVEDFLAKLGSKQAQKVAWVLRVVRDLSIVPQQYMKKLEGSRDIGEVRADFGGDAFRLLGFWDGGRLLVLTNAFAKKSQKTPEAEIALAEQRKGDHLSRKKKP